jgi:hypothetical protein
MLVVVIYVLLALLLSGANYVSVMLFIALALIIANLVYAIIGYRHNRESAVWLSRAKLAALVYKIALTPFFILNFFYWLDVFFLNPIHVDPEQIGELLTVMALTYLPLLPGTTYSAAAICRERSSLAVRLWQLALYLLLQFIFVADVISYGVFCYRTRKARPALESGTNPPL